MNMNMCNYFFMKSDSVNIVINTKADIYVKTELLLCVKIYFTCCIILWYLCFYEQGVPTRGLILTEFDTACDTYFSMQKTIYRASK